MLHAACRLRPHFKAHKTPEIARRQLAAGSCTGLTCATVLEAEVAASSSEDILIANEIVGPERCRRVAALAKRVTMTIAIDSAAGLDEISAAAREGQGPIGALVDVNVGQNRCGVVPGDDAVALGKLVAAAPGVTLRGLMGYEGHAVGIANRSERETAVRPPWNSSSRPAAVRGGGPIDGNRLGRRNRQLRHQRRHRRNH